MFLRSIQKSISQQNKRTMYWMCKETTNYVIGLKKDTVNLIGGVKKIEITSDTEIRKNEGLFLVESNLMTTSIINAPFDCAIVCHNKSILNTINYFPEHKDIGWILKIVPIAINYNKYKKELDTHFEESFSYNNNTQEIPWYCINY